jgi:hypothetical protein
VSYAHRIEARRQGGLSEALWLVLVRSDKDAGGRIGMGADVRGRTGANAICMSYRQLKFSMSEPNVIIFFHKPALPPAFSHK